MTPRRLALLASSPLALFTACAAPQAVAPAAPPVEVTTPAPPPAPPAPPEAKEEPLPPREDALARGIALAQEWDQGPRYHVSERSAWLAERHLDDETVRRLLAAVTKPCLAERDGEAAACATLGPLGKPTDMAKAAEVLEEMLGYVADPAAPGGASLRLLVRLGARGAWRAGMAVDTILERRMEAGADVFAPPTKAEIDAARRDLADFAVMAPASQGFAARWPTAAELDDLAYFYAAVPGAAGPEIGSAKEDLAAPPLPAGHPDHAARKDLDAQVQAALLDGDLDKHLAAADAYLRSLGYPDPLRIAEESDVRWGGPRVSYLMREAARSAEILGRYDVAEALYRRAHPGGGACGTSTPSQYAEQIHGAIRVAEQRRGCRAVAAERLFATGRGASEAYGPERLGKAGFDVARLYAGALLTLGRDDAAELSRALGALPSHSGEALARLAQRGPEAWAARVRAIPGYADSAGGAALDRLLSLAERGPASARKEALWALGRVAEDHGYDPCIKSSFGIGWGHGSSSRERQVHSVMGECQTRIPAKAVDGAARRIAAMAGDPDPEVREGVAAALGRLGLPAARPTLVQLGRDTFDAGGQVCTSVNGGPQKCGPNRPVARAAQEGLEALKQADETRRQQRAAKEEP